MARGELALKDASADMRRLYVEATEWRSLTEGAFTAERPDGVVDLAGIVKSHAIREAGTSLLALGLKDWCLNAGGDVLVDGSPTPGSTQPWLAGIVDPEDRTTLLTAFPLGAGGPNTRWRPREPANAATIFGLRASRAARDEGFRQVSVAAADIITADVLSTAIMAGGARTLDAGDVPLGRGRARGEERRRTARDTGLPEPRRSESS